MADPAGGQGWRGYALLSVAWLALFGGALFVLRRPPGEPIEIVPAPTRVPTTVPAASPTSSLLHVDVAGAVRAPAVYELPPGSIVANAIAAAGGPTEDADLDRINKAVALEDGVQVYVPRQGETIMPAQRLSPLSLTEPPVGSDSNKIDINLATEQELESLPGVGPVIAGRIVNGRPYGAVEDLLRVNGIGTATFEKMRDHVVVR